MCHFYSPLWMYHNILMCIFLNNFTDVLDTFSRGDKLLLKTLHSFEANIFFTLTYFALFFNHISSCITLCSFSETWQPEDYFPDLTSTRKDSLLFHSSGNVMGFLHVYVSLQYQSDLTVDISPKTSWEDNVEIDTNKSIVLILSESRTKLMWTTAQTI